MVFIPRREKIYRETLPCEGMGKEIFGLLKQINDTFEEEGLPFNIMVKGGTSRGFVGERARLPAKKCAIATDLDLVLIHTFTLEKELKGKNIFRAAEIMQKALNGTLSNEDIETIRYKPGEVSGIPNTVRGVLLSRDMTVNETVITFKNGRLVLYYTDECLRDIRCGNGLLSTNNSTVVRPHVGRLTILPYGAARLIRFAVEGKANFIYLPERDIEILWNEAHGKEPLGVYGLMLCHRYQDFSELQEKLMRILVSTGLTKEKSFIGYREKLKKEFFIKNGYEFQLRQRTFEEILHSRKNRMETQKIGRTFRKDDRDNCCHPETTEDRIENGPDMGYSVLHCKDCGFLRIKNKAGRELGMEALPSNRNLMDANIKALPDMGFFNIGKILGS